MHELLETSCTTSQFNHGMRAWTSRLSTPPPPQAMSQDKSLHITPARSSSHMSRFAWPQLIHLALTAPGTQCISWAAGAILHFGEALNEHWQWPYQQCECLAETELQEQLQAMRLMQKVACVSHALIGLNIPQALQHSWSPSLSW